MGKKTLEQITAEDIVKYICDEGKLREKDGKVQIWIGEQLIEGISQILEEYAENWAGKSAHDWLIDHHP